MSGPLTPRASERTLENYSGFHQEVGHVFTFGMLFVKNYGDQPVVLDEVALVDATGGIELVGARAADVTGPKAHMVE